MCCADCVCVECATRAAYVVYGVWLRVVQHGSMGDVQLELWLKLYERDRRAGHACTLARGRSERRLEFTQLTRARVEVG